MATTWFTSDQHFGHANIIRHCARPFADVAEMNEAMVERFNARVRPADLTWHVGDFALDERLVPKFLRRLNGRHALIMGNHDRCHPCHRGRSNKYLAHGFETIRVDHLIATEIGIVRMCHFPAADDETDVRYQEWRPRRDGWRWLLCGHIHDRWAARGNMINVGVDVRGFAPVSWDEIVAIA